MTGLPLSGLRVLDFTHAAAGPFATMLLADMGADVIKIERPTYGDGARSMGSPMPGFPFRNSDYYLALNRNKKGIVLDLAQPKGVEIALRLVDSSDIVVENFRPDVMDRLGLGFEVMRERRANLVYCSISAFGEDGPWAGRPANDIIMQSVTGLMAVTGELGGGPVKMGAPVADFSTGLFALAGVLAALHARGDHPEGQHVRVSMFEASLNFMCNYIPSVVDLGAKIPRLGRAHAQIVPYQAFECADGEYVMVGAFNRTFWSNLCHTLGHTEWLEDPRYSKNSARLKNRAALIGELEEIFRSKTVSEWMDILDKGDVPSSPVLELHESVRLDEVSQRGSIVESIEDDRKVSYVRSPIRTTAWPEPPSTMPPDIGRDTERILTDVLLMSDEELSDLASAGVIGTPIPQEG